jgi:hypothetical protein
MNCPSCGCSKTEYHGDFGYWTCDLCACAWGNDDDDPDYEELVHTEEEVELMERAIIGWLEPVRKALQDG